jgi:succinate dehydrogenase flavin-adding protein (antitoxin of CptAB toxin-antitoxin module)
MSDDLDVRRRRAGFRANHRGTKEMDGSQMQLWLA